MRVPNIADAASVNAMMGAGSTPAPAPSSATPQSADAQASQPAATFSSPVSTFDPVTGAAILQYRDPRTGMDTYQTPARAVLQYQQAQRQAESKAKASAPA